MTICNMPSKPAQERHHRPDDKTWPTSRPHLETFTPLYSDADATYAMDKIMTPRLWSPCVAEPHVPSNYALAPRAHRSED